MSLTYSTRFTIANFEDQHLSTKKKFKPIYSKKYKLREKTNLEPLIPMDDQEINKQFIQKCTGALSFSSLIDTYQTVKETPKSISGVKKKKTNEKKKRCQRAAPHSQSSAADYFFDWYNGLRQL